MAKTDYRQAEFLISAHSIAQLPQDKGTEIAFAGRSNAGKSSVINIVTGRKGLARISKTPGRTRLINLFSLGENNRLVDLPGYGFAKVPQQLRQHWAQTLNTYFTTRNSLQGLVLITDIRRELTEFDRQMLHWCHTARLPLHILLNKSDKLSYGAAKKILIQVTGEAAKMDVTVQLFSALKKTGVDELRARLDSWLT
jgi:GTP-binding protein